MKTKVNSGSREKGGLFKAPKFRYYQKKMHFYRLHGDIINAMTLIFPFLDGDVPRRPSYGVYISQLIRFARVCSHVEDFKARNKCLKANLLKQGYRYHKLRKAFSKLYRRHFELISKFNVG